MTVRQITVETSFYPFVLLSFRAPTDADYRGLFDTMTQLSRKALRENTKHVCIIVSGSNISPGTRKLIASLVERFPEELMSPFAGSYVIMDNTLLRGLLTALRWLSPRLANLETPATLEEAITAGAARLRELHVEVPNTEILGARNWLRTESNRVHKARSLRV